MAPATLATRLGVCAGLDRFSRAQSPGTLGHIHARCRREGRWNHWDPGGVGWWMIQRVAIAALLVATAATGCGSTVGDGPPPPAASPSSALPGDNSSTMPAGQSAPRSAAPDRPILGQTFALTFEGVLYAAKGDGSARTVITDFPGLAEPYAGAFWSPKGDRLIIRTRGGPGVGLTGGDPGKRQTRTSVAISKDRRYPSSVTRFAHCVPL